MSAVGGVQRRLTEAEHQQQLEQRLALIRARAGDATTGHTVLTHSSPVRSAPTGTGAPSSYAEQQQRRGSEPRMNTEESNAVPEEFTAWDAAPVNGQQPGAISTHNAAGGGGSVQRGGNGVASMHSDTGAMQRRRSNSARPTPAGYTSAAIGGNERVVDREERRRAALEDITREVREREQAECTFQPRINKGYVPRNKHHQPTFERLSRDMKEEYQRREEQREIRLAQQRQKCPFRPQLSRRTEQYACVRRAGRAGEMDDLGEQLYKEAEELELRQQQQQLSVRSREMVGMFQPSINRYGPASAAATGGIGSRASSPSPCAELATPRPSSDADGFRRPLHERVDEIRRDRAERIQHLRQKWGEEQELTFQPQIGIRSRSADGEPHVVDRLYTPSQQQTSVQRPATPRELSQMRDGPSLTRRSRQLATKRSEYRRHPSFTDRFAEQERQREQRIEELRKVAAEEETKPTKRVSEPHIRHHLQEMQERSRARAENVEHLRKEIEQGMFRPQQFGSTRRSNSAQPRRNSGGTTPPRLRRDADVARLAEAQREKEQRECTFRPMIDARSRRLAPRRNQPPNASGSVLYARDDSALRQAERRAAHSRNEEDKQCTFRPQVLHKSARSRAAPPDVPVAGMDQYMQRREAARLAEEDRRRREEEASRVKPSALAHVHRVDHGGRLHTVPQPFELSTGTRVRHARGDDELTFQPVTVQGTRTRVLTRMLVNDEDDAPAVADGWGDAGDEAVEQGSDPNSEWGELPETSNDHNEILMQEANKHTTTQPGPVQGVDAPGPPQRRASSDQQRSRHRDPFR